MLNYTKGSKQTIEKLSGENGPTIVTVERYESRSFRHGQNQPPSAEEQTQRLLKVGFFQWLLNYILNSWLFDKANKLPPTSKEIGSILVAKCSGAEFDIWRGVIASIKRKQLTSLERALLIMWPFPMDDSAELTSNSSLMTMGNHTLLCVPAENLLKLIEFRRALLRRDDLNTHIVRVMNMIGRDRHISSEEAQRPKSHVDVPCTNIKLKEYELDNPTKHKRYGEIMKESFGPEDGKNTLVPPMYCLIHKAVCKLNSAIEFFKHLRIDQLHNNPRNLQTAKLDLIAYLEQVINLTHVSRTGEVISQALTDTVFWLQLGARGDVVKVPVAIAAFVPELLSSFPSSYSERTNKSKQMQQEIIHIHDMLPSTASLLSMPHAIALVLRLMFMIDTEIMDPRKNESMSLFVKRSVKGDSAFSKWTTTDSGVRTIQRAKKQIKTFDANTLPKDAAVDDFTPYSSRYLAASTFVKMELVPEPSINRKKRGSSSVSAIVHPSSVSGPSSSSGIADMLKDSIMAQNCLDYIRSMQFGHADGSGVIENIYSINTHRMGYKDSEHGGSLVHINHLSFGSDYEYKEECREVRKLLATRVLRQMTVFPGSKRLLCTEDTMSVVEANSVLVHVVKDAALIARVKKATEWFSTLCTHPKNKAATDSELDCAIQGLVGMVNEEIKNTCKKCESDEDDENDDDYDDACDSLAIVPPFRCKVLEAAKSLRPLLVISCIKLDSSDIPTSWVKLLEEYALNIKVWGGSFGREVADPVSDPVILTNIARMMFYCDPATLRKFSSADKNVDHPIIPRDAEVKVSSLPDPLGTGANVSVVNIRQSNDKKYKKKLPSSSAVVNKKKKKKMMAAAVTEEEDDRVSDADAPTTTTCAGGAGGGGEDYPDTSEIENSSSSS